MAEPAEDAAGWHFWIDRGGTFTDLVARAPDGSLITRKLLSERGDGGTDPAILGIRQVLGLAEGEPIPASLVASVKMGTTVATNALLQRRGAAVLLIVNRGFADMLLIGDQSRPRLFDLAIGRPAPLDREVAEITGRIGADGIEVEALDEAAAARMLQEAAARGLRACAIALMHAWAYPGHELRLVRLARDAGFTQISASHQVSPTLRLIPRAQTASVDAYLSPVLRRAVDRLSAELDGVNLLFMQSHGGLTGAADFQGKDAVLSGPAGGIVGAARTAAQAGFTRIISFDMGGTSTDVALHDGALERRFDTQIAGVRLRVPMLAIDTVAAGGGSILRFADGRMQVGPESAGADPGPAAYRAGGPLTVTDANICVGKLQPAHFPAIFGPGGDQPLDAAAVRAKFAALAAEIARATGSARDPRTIASGFLQIAVANMANAIRQVSVQKGRDPAGFALQCFGGAGGQHACLVAEELGMTTVLIHPLAGVLSAYGMGLADRSALREQAIERDLAAELLPELQRVAARLEAEARAVLLAQGADAARLRAGAQLHLRTRGTDAALTVGLAPLDQMLAAFAEAHRARFGFAVPDGAITVEAVSVEVIEPGAAIAPAQAPARQGGAPEPIDQVEMFCSGRAMATKVFDREALCAGDRLEGPALLREATATTVIEPGWVAELTPERVLLLQRSAGSRRAEAVDGPPDPALLELFGNLFMNIAEQAGAVLQNVATSVNIKERLDFSCAIFDAAGDLVANAPHVPVHLGAMGESVKAVLRARGRTLRPGDMIALNDPANGGTHLPDITLVHPVLSPDGDEIRCFVACRGHHADVGGLTPGSTPPFSRTLAEEGVVIDDFLVCREGDFFEQAFRALLAGPPHPARNPDMNVADLRAQIAANARAAQEWQGAVTAWGFETVRGYMRHVMDNAEECIRRVIAGLLDGAFETTLDDGTRLCVAVRIDRAARSATIDFTGTGGQSARNFNAPPAVTRAVVLYVFRCLADREIPLNEGCLKPIKLIIPPDSFLAPGPSAAVVAGNTEVSQIVANALLGALGVAASSQATMNNFLFGDARRQYYETICGGAGAGAGFDGCAAVHTHMTNTRMTDPEVLERHYPARMEEFSVRRGSGGAGRRRGGDGARRRLRFLEPMTASLVASRRTVAPFGLAGGEDGAAGRQWVDHPDGRRTMLDGLAQIAVEAGDVVVIETPGGGGYAPER
jgi:5-oxoprolinase (ATP-hydrolysing)